MTDLRPQSEIAEEIGQRVIEAADSIRKYVPDCQAIINFTLDGADYIAIVRDKPRGPQHDQTGE